MTSFSADLFQQKITKEALALLLFDPPGLTRLEP